MRKMFLLAAAAIMVPGAVSAQSAMSQPEAAPTDTSTTMNAQPEADTMAQGTPGSATGSSAESAAPSTGAADAGMPAGDASSAMAAGSSSDMSANEDATSPSAAVKKAYPKCSRTVQDSCRNPGGK